LLLPRKKNFGKGDRRMKVSISTTGCSSGHGVGKVKEAERVGAFIETFLVNAFILSQNHPTALKPLGG